MLGSGPKIVMSIFGPLPSRERQCNFVGRGVGLRMNFFSHRFLSRMGNSVETVANKLCVVKYLNWFAKGGVPNPAFLRR